MADQLTREQISIAALEAGFSIATMCGQADKQLMPMADCATLEAFAKKIIALSSSQQARNSALDEVIELIPGGSICDPQWICDQVRALKSPSPTPAPERLYDELHPYWCGKQIKTTDELIAVVKEEVSKAWDDGFAAGKETPSHPSSVAMTDADTIALEVARKIMATIDGAWFPGGVTQTQAKIQCISTAQEASKQGELPDASGALPTHRCKVCSALWRFIPNRDTGWGDSWNLRSKTCGPCCDGAEMADQIEPLTWSMLSDYRFVPKEYTDEQLAGGLRQLYAARASGASDESICGVIYDGMVAAAPAPSQSLDPVEQPTLSASSSDADKRDAERINLVRSGYRDPDGYEYTFAKVRWKNGEPESALFSTIEELDAAISRMRDGREKP